MKWMALVLSIGYLGTFNLGFGEITKAYADIRPTEGNQVHGRVVFQKEGDQVLIVAELKGLKPGLHGFHIHEKGDCSAKDASSAGTHFNPFQEPHAAPFEAKRHVGDLGNVIANEKGDAVYEELNDLVQLEGPHSIIGKAVIIHADPDDFKTQPTGNAGSRLGCGVIQAMK